MKLLATDYQTKPKTNYEFWVKMRSSSPALLLDNDLNIVTSLIVFEINITNKTYRMKEVVAYDKNHKIVMHEQLSSEKFKKIIPESTFDFIYSTVLTWIKVGEK